MDDLCRKHGVSSPTVYKWKAKIGGMEVSEAKRLRALEDEDAKLKRIVNGGLNLPISGGSKIY